MKRLSLVLTLAFLMVFGALLAAQGAEVYTYFEGENVVQVHAHAEKEELNGAASSHLYMSGEGDPEGSAAAWTNKNWAGVEGEIEAEEFYASVEAEANYNIDFEGSKIFETYSRSFHSAEVKSADIAHWDGAAHATTGLFDTKTFGRQSFGALNPEWVDMDVVKERYVEVFGDEITDQFAYADADYYDFSQSGIIDFIFGGSESGWDATEGGASASAHGMSAYISGDRTVGLFLYNDNFPFEWVVAEEFSAHGTVSGTEDYPFPEGFYKSY